MSHFEKVGVIFITGLVAIILALSLFGSGKQESETGMILQDSHVAPPRDLAAPTKPSPSRTDGRLADASAKSKRNAQKSTSADELWNAVKCTPPESEKLSSSTEVTPLEAPRTLAGGEGLDARDANVAADVGTSGSKKAADPATDAASATTPSGDVEHVIAAGENYYSLARRFYHDPTKWQLIAKANKVPSERLRAGMKITIPALPSRSPAVADPKSPSGAAKDATAKKPTTPSSDAAANAKKPTPPPGDAADGAAHTYKVKKGDTLSQIAQSQLGTVKLLAKLEEANKDVLDGHSLREGMTLRIPAARQ